MSALLDSLAAGFEGDATRRALLDEVLRDGLPARAEAWKYTSLRQLERRSFAPATAVAVDAALLAAIPAPRIVFVNGQFDATLSDLTTLPAGIDVRPLSRLLQGDDPRAVNFLERRYQRLDEPFARLNAALAREGAAIRVDAGVRADAPLHLVHVGAAQDDGDAATLRADGVLLADGRRHVDTRLGIDHIARDTACNLTWRGLAGQRGKAVFHGGIIIRAGADGTAADLSNKNLLLSNDAEIDTQPVLEIHADEVKAAHGATVGQLDATALFYLRSRGLPEPEARALLTGAFCREVVAGIEDEATRALCDAALDRALARLGA